MWRKDLFGLVLSCLDVSFQFTQIHFDTYSPSHPHYEYHHPTLRTHDVAG